jgi:hypothetical protein
MKSMCCSVREWREGVGVGESKKRRRKAEKNVPSNVCHVKDIFNEYIFIRTTAVTTLFCNFYTFILLSYSTPFSLFIHSSTSADISLTYDDDGMTLFFCNIDDV